MTTLAALILALTALILIVVMIRGGVRQQPELISTRNFFLLGLLVFQFTSGIIGLTMPDFTNSFAIPDRQGPGVKYTVVLLIFTFGMLFVYSKGFIADKLVRLTHPRRIYIAWPNLLTLSILCVVLGVLCRVVLIHIPYIGIFTLYLGASFFALATGLAAWAWAPRLFNPIPAVVSAVVTLAGIVVLFSDSFGRRDLLGIGLAFVWGAYYSHWRYMSHKKLITRFVVVATLGIFFLASYTSTRSTFAVDSSSVSERIRGLATADIKQGTADLFSGQGAATNSMYFIHTRPRSIEYDTLHSIKLFCTLPIPRTIWPTKPDGLSITSIKEISSEGKAKEWNIGPGLVGHIFNDNPFIALPLYIFIIAVSLRLADQMMSRHAQNPFLVLPLGVALGQIVALPRGELGTFYAKAILYTFGGWVAMMFVAQIHKLFSPHTSMALEESTQEDQYDDSYGQDYDDGYEYDSQSNQYDEYQENHGY